MQPCARSDLVCDLPLGVAFNRAGRRQLIWDGHRVNAYLCEEDFRMETLQREGRALFGDARYGGTVDFSAAYPHVHVRPYALPYQGFEWQGQFYRFSVLPFGLASAPRIFTAVHRARRPFPALRGDWDSSPPLSGRSDFHRSQNPPDHVRRMQRADHPIRCAGYIGASETWRCRGFSSPLAQLGTGRGRGARPGPKGPHHVFVGGGW